MKTEPFLKLERADGGRVFEVTVECRGGHMHVRRKFLDCNVPFIIFLEPGDRLGYLVSLRSICIK